MSRSKGVYVLRTQHENAGDLLINDLLLRELSKHADMEIDDSGVPPDFQDALTMKHLPRTRMNPKVGSVRGFKFFALASARRSPYEFLFLKPGDQRRNTAKSQRLYMLKAATYLWLAQCGVKIVRLGTSFAKLPVSQQNLERRLAKAFAFMSVRDSLSNTDNNLDLPVLPDIAFLLDDDYLEVKPVEGRYVVLSFRGDLYEEEIAAKLQTTLDEVMQSLTATTDRQVIFVAQVHRDSKWMKVCAERYTALYPGRVSFKEIGLDLKAALSLYRHAELVLSNRLHVALTTLVIGGPALAFVERRHDRKIWGLFEDNNWKDLLIFFDESDATVATVQSFLTDEDKRVATATRVSADVKARRSELQTAIAKLFT